MLSETQVELIHREIDGLTTREESARVKKLIDELDEARQLYEEMLTLAQELSLVEQAEPSANVKKRVMNVIAAMQPAAKYRNGVFQRTLETLRTRLRFDYAVLFFGGLIAGLAIFVVLGKIPGGNIGPDADKLYGTAALGVNEENWVTLNRLPFAWEDAQGEAVLHSAASLVRLTLKFSAQEALTFAVQWDGRSLQFGGLQNEEAGDYLEFVKKENHIEYQADGKNRVRFLFKRVSSTTPRLQIQIFAGDVLKLEHDFDVGER